MCFFSQNPHPCPRQTSHAHSYADENNNQRSACSQETTWSSRRKRATTIKVPTSQASSSVRRRGQLRWSVGRICWSVSEAKGKKIPSNPTSVLLVLWLFEGAKGKVAILWGPVDFKSFLICLYYKYYLCYEYSTIKYMFKHFVKRSYNCGCIQCTN